MSTHVKDDHKERSPCSSCHNLSEILTTWSDDYPVVSDDIVRPVLPLNAAVTDTEADYVKGLYTLYFYNL